PVAEDGRRVAARRRPDLADHERLAVPVDDVGVAARSAQEVAHPVGGAQDITRVGGVGADRRNAKKLGELVEPRFWHACEPNRRRVGGKPRRFPSQIRYATSRSFSLSASARSFFSPWLSIWRIRSRVTRNARPTSSSVHGAPPFRP